MRPLRALLFLLPGAAWASHPLISEDTGVLGRGVWQLEVHGERSREAGAYASELSPVLSYGLTDQADLQLEQPYARAEGRTRREDLLVSIKWRFFESDGLSMVLKPDLYEGGRWGLNFAAAYEVGRVELLAHAGYLRNQHHASIATRFAVSEKLKLVADLSRDTQADRAMRGSIREIVAGMELAARDNVDLGVGVKKGLSDAADERTLLAGIKLRF